VRGVLNKAYYDRRKNRGGPIAWPRRTPGLNPVNIFACENTQTPSFMQCLLTTIALGMLVRLLATALASLNGCGGP
jgi:hypothetical protein